MSKLFRKRILFPIISAIALVFSLAMFFINSPRTEAAEVVSTNLSGLVGANWKFNTDNMVNMCTHNQYWTASTFKQFTDNTLGIGYLYEDDGGSQSGKTSSSVKYTVPNGQTIGSVTISLTTTKPVKVTYRAYKSGWGNDITIPQTSTSGGYTYSITKGQIKTPISFSLTSGNVFELFIKDENASTNILTSPVYTGGKVARDSVVAMTALSISLGSAAEEVSIAAGTGVKSVYLSTEGNAISGSASGTEFESETTVYGYAELAKGYKAKSGWVLVSGNANTEGAKYRVGSVTAGSDNFGTISADAISYTISYNLNGGTHGKTHPTSYNITTNTFTISNPTRTGYTFDGWSGTGITNKTTTLSVAKGSTGNRSYTANWTADTYTIAFDKNAEGATGTTNSVTATYDSEITLTDNGFSKVGYDFKGWATSSTGSVVYADGATLTAAQVNNLYTTAKKGGTYTLYASWRANEYTVTLDDNGGSGGQGSMDVIFASNIEPITAIPTKAGYTFAGYYDEQNEDGAASPTGTCYISATGGSVKAWDKPSDATLYAYYTKNMTVSATGYEADYDGAEHTITVTVTDPASDYFIIYVDPETTSNTNVNPALTNVGEYTINFYVNKSGYTQYHGSATIIIKEVDKTTLKAAIDDFIEYLQSLDDNYNDIKPAINSEFTAIYDDFWSELEPLYTDPKLNVTKGQIDQAILDINSLKSNVEDVAAVIEKINAIKNANNNDELQDLLEIAEEAYSALSNYQKSFIPQATIDKLSNYDTVALVVSKVDAIGAPQNTQAFRDAVSSARADYNDLNDDQKALFPVPVFDTLKNDEAIIPVMDKIDAIGDVKYTSACKELIDEANDSYAALTPDQKALVVNYDKLVEANTDYNNVDKSVTDINAIGDVVYTPECKAKIDTARETYDALTEAQKAIQPQMFLNELVDAEKAYTAMDKIHSIATPEFTDEYKDALLDARNYYDNLSDDQKGMVLNYQDLINAEKAYEAMTLINAIKDTDNYVDFANAVSAAKEKFDVLSPAQLAILPEAYHNTLSDALLIKPTISKIDAIGEVSHTDECKALIDDANDSYAALTDSQKELVQCVNYDKLVKANLDYDNVDESINKINNIGEFEFTDECKAKIDEARAIYDELTEDQKAILPDDILKTLEDDEHAYNAMNLIKNIGEVKNTNESRALVTAAREYLDDLTADQLDLVDPAFIKILEDDEAALSVMDKINNIGKVEYTKDCKAKIDAARTSYDGLTDDQKAIVNANNYKVLTDAEKAYADTDNAHKKIDDIGSVKRTDVCKASIDKARATYDALTAEEKAIMPAEQYNALVNAEKAYGALVEIYNIGEVSYDTESDDKIKAAREAYNSLSDDQKKLIDNNDLKVLTDKEADFNSTDKAATIWGVILLILSIIALGVGCYFLYLVLRKNNKNNTVKVSSSVLPLTILTSYFATGSYLAFYIVSSCALAVWAAVLVIYLLKKKGVIMASTASGAVAMENVVIQENINANNYIPVEAATSDTENEEVQEEDASEEDVVETTRDASGNIFKIQYISSFTAKLIQSSDEIKRQYSELRKEVLSYSGTKSKTTWHFDTISYGRTVILRFGIRGKTLCVYYALNYEDFENSKYKLENVTSKKHSSAPCLYRIKNDRRFDYAKELIEILAKKYDLIKEEKEIEDIMPPYEDRDTLVSKGLIKKLEVKLTSNNKKITEITVDEANKAMSNDAALGCVITDNDSKIHEGKKEVVNVSVLEEQYNDGDTVTIESLIEKGIINSKVGYVKLLAGGKLDKKLNVELQDYSIEAVKMIILLGGTVKKVR